VYIVHWFIQVYTVTELCYTGMQLDRRYAQQNERPFIDQL